MLILLKVLASWSKNTGRLSICAQKILRVMISRPSDNLKHKNELIMYLGSKSSFQTFTTTIFRIKLEFRKGLFSFGSLYVIFLIKWKIWWNKPFVAIQLMQCNPVGSTKIWSNYTKKRSLPNSSALYIHYVNLEHYQQTSVWLPLGEMWYIFRRKDRRTYIFFSCIFRLPVPWFLYTVVFQEPITVSAEGMVCSIAILFMMLILVFMSILLFNWKMTKPMGVSMFVFYFLFVLVSLGFENNYYECPL